MNDYRRGSTGGGSSGGGAGFASLTIPAKAFGSTSHYGGEGHRSRRDLGRNGSFGRDRSLSRSQGSLASGMGTRSVSLSSLNSEGYIVSLGVY